MKAIVKKFENGEKFQTKQSVTLPLSVLCSVNEIALQFIDENDCDGMEVFIKIGQPNVDKSQIELEIWAK